MAVYDADAQRIIVRVVYDGPGRAGKTTNLERLCDFFTTMRRGELFTPAESDQGRTLHFDWLNLEGGLIGGHRVRCQLVTVPGQRVLRSRRAHLVSTADVVVFVCEATESGIDSAKPMLDEILSLQTKERPLPLVVQANKQDLPGVLDDETLRERLGLGSTVPVVQSRADEGQGVKETAVLAVRAAAELLQQHVAVHGVHSLAGDADDEEALLARMQAIGIDFEVPDPKTVSSRGERRGESTAGAETREPPAEPEPSEPPAEPEPSEPPAEPEPTEPPAEPEPTDGASNDAPAESRRSWTRPAPGAPPPGERMSLAARMADFDPTKPTPAPPARRTTPYRPGRKQGKTRLPPLPKAAAIPEPPLPDGHAPSGQLWPPALGRQVLRGLDLGEAVLRADLTGQQGKTDGSGRNTVIYQLGDWALKTRPERRYRDLDAGRAALVRLARQKIAIGDLMPPNTVLALQLDRTDVLWLWTVTPWTPSLRAEMQRAEQDQNADELGEALETYAAACVRSLVLAHEDGVTLDIHPSNYARASQGVYYIDDDFGEGRRIASSGFALLKRAEEYADVAAAVERYATALESGIRDRLDASAARTLDLEALLRDVPLRDERAAPIRDRLVATVRSLR